MQVLVANNGFAFYLALFFPFSTYFINRGLLKQRELVRNGEVAVATITSTSNSPSVPNRNDDVRLVEYQFRDRTGDLITGRTTDPTFLLRDGSAMLVFYDAADSTEQVAQCAGYYEVASTAPDWRDEIG